MVVVYYLGFYFVCSSYVAPRENFRAKAQESICRRKVLSDNPSTRIHEVFVSTPHITPIGGTIIEVKSTLQLQKLLCVNKSICSCALYVGPKLQPQPLE